MTRILLLLFFASNFIHAQEAVETFLDSINDIEKAELYLTSNPSKSNKLVTFNEEKHKTILANDLFSKGSSTIENDFEKVHYKVVETKSITHYRVSYIYLDGKKLNTSEINTLRSQIINKYTSGVSFEKLAKQYSMDGNANRGGDLGWFAKGEMHPIFEEAIINSDLNQIFSIDIPESNWYYVVLVTHEPKNIKEISVLKIVTPKS